MSPQTLGRSDNDAKGLGDKVENRTVRTNEVQTRNLARRGRRHVRACRAYWTHEYWNRVPMASPPWARLVRSRTNQIA